MPRYFYENLGTLDFKLRELHEKHGHIVRYGTNHLSMTDSAAFKDLYGYGKNNLIKDPTVHGLMTKGQTELGIIQAGNVEHAKIRRQLAHAFSERALREQEGIIQGYVNTLITQLGEAADHGEKVDIMHKYMYTTSDITSELAFGTSFDSLLKEDLRPLVHLQDKFGAFITRGRLLARFPMLAPLIALVMDRKAIGMIKQNRVWVSEVVDRRLEQGTMEEKRDFLSYVLKHKDEDVAMTDNEIRETSRTMITAGAETSRTGLSTITYLLATHPEEMRRVQQEVRDAFPTEESIKFTEASSKLTYMLACLDEALRLHPAVPSHIMGRVIGSDGPHVVAGEVMPPGTFIVMHPIASMTTSRNFSEPLTFHPERWSSDKDERFMNDDKAAFQPFSYGPRNCIGRNLAYSKMRLILARVLWNFDIELCEESQGWDQQKILGFWQGGPLWVKLRRRKPSD